MEKNSFKYPVVARDKSKLTDFYLKNKKIIYMSIISLIIILISTSFYLNHKEKKIASLSSNYVRAKIILKNGDKDTAKNILNEIVLSNNPTYSALSFFLMLNENLIEDKNKISTLFDHLLKNNKYEKEIKDLIIFKKFLFQSNFIDESELLEGLKPLINANSIWKPHALFLLGSYYVHNNEYIKASEFFTEILSIPNLTNDLYDQTIFQLSAISSE